MKKFAIFTLAAVMVFCLSFTVYAESLTGGSADVTGEYVSGTQTEVYSADISWGSFEFKYNAEHTVWNPETHSYETTAEAYWECADGADTVTVTNHSSGAVTATVGYTPDSAYSAVTGTFDKTSMTIAAPMVGSAQEDAPSASARLTLSGALSSAASGAVKLGTVTVTLAAADGSTVSSGNSGNTDASADAVGYLNLFAKNNLDAMDVKYDIYEESETVYYARFTVAEGDITDDSSLNQDTVIHINGTDYYIYEPHPGSSCYKFLPGSTVDINTTKYDDSGLTPAKTTAVEVGKTYLLKVDLGTMKATLEEIA